MFQNCLCPLKPDLSASLANAMVHKALRTHLLVKVQGQGLLVKVQGEKSGLGHVFQISLPKSVTRPFPNKPNPAPTKEPVHRPFLQPPNPLSRRWSLSCNSLRWGSSVPHSCHPTGEHWDSPPHFPGTQLSPWHRCVE